MDSYIADLRAAAQMGLDLKIFHVLFAVDIEEDDVRIVTAYYPDPEEWKKDFKTRR